MKRANKEKLIGALLLLPSAGGLMLFYFIPFCISIYYSFSKVSGKFVYAGLANYSDTLGSAAFRVAFSNTFIFLGIALALMLVCGYALAAMLRRISRRSQGLGSLGVTAVLLPLVLPSGAVLLFFQALVEPFGALNGLLAHSGISQVRWLQSQWAFWILLVFYLWKNTGYTVTIMLSGLLSVPEDMLEAARMDGAHGLQLFFRFTFVHMLPFFSIAAVMGIIAAFKMYRESYMLMGLYPHQSVYMLQNYLYNNFASLNYQRLSSASVMFTLVLGAVLFVLMRVCLRSRE